MVAVVVAGLALGIAGLGAAVNDPVAVTITAASSPVGQACVTVVVKDSVTGDPVAADFVLLISGIPGGTGEVPASSNSSGSGSACFNPPSSNLPGTVSGASVTLRQATRSRCMQARTIRRPAPATPRPSPSSGRR